MEEGYLAKIIHGDGAKEIKVGEVYIIDIAIVMRFLSSDFAVQLSSDVTLD